MRRRSIDTSPTVPGSRAFRIALLGIVAIACLLIAGTKQPRWHEYYKPITDPEATRFAADALAEATSIFGPPAIPVRTLHLRTSTPRTPGTGYREGFLLTELVDAAAGEFCIYVSKEAGHISFHGELAHEVFHLLNAKFYDSYIEGLATCFAERWITKKKLDWPAWEKHFLDGNGPLHGTTYFMMKEVAAKVGDEHLRTILGFGKYFDATETRMWLDIDAWLGTLPADTKSAVRGIIYKHAPAVTRAMATSHYQVSFVLPK
ncbi:MAG: hypothetical protein L0Z55_08990 [Planctomycetes bacterium]|nr:hypothetical protein [Planctomycetota bacterium]